MAGFARLLASIAEAVCARGFKTLAECVPLGGAVYEIAETACQRMREGQLAAMIRAAPADVKEEAERAAAVAPPADRARLAGYLTQLPATLRRAGRGLRPEDLLELLPRAAPGDAVPGFAHWRLDGLLGVGGSGEVWRAVHADLPALGPVAAKLFRDPKAARHEAGLVAGLSHPGVVRLRDAALNDSCLLFEYVAGGDLTSILETPAEPARVVGLLRELADVLAYAHSRTPAVVHRDLKPANVLLDGGRLRLTDFGIGADAARPLTTTLRGSHTPLYASPEQARGEEPDPRDDVYALGVIGYQLLVGEADAGPSGLWADELRDRGVGPDLIRLLGECLGPARRRPADGAALLARLNVPGVPDGRLRRFLDGGAGSALFGLLDLTGQAVGDDGLRALAASPRLAALDALILSGCGVGDDGVAALAASPHAANLRRLVLWDNRVGDAGVRAVAESESLAALTTLDVGRNRVGDDGVKALAASPSMRSLTALILVSNRVGDEGALALASSPHLSELAELKPLDNRIGPAGAAALQAAFGRRVRVM